MPAASASATERHGGGLRADLPGDGRGLWPAAEDAEQDRGEDSRRDAEDGDDQKR